MTLILWLVAAYAAICTAAFFGNRLLMYFPDPTRVAPIEVGLNGVRELEIAAADGTTLTVWYAPAKDEKPTILYFHGNGANAANRAPKIQKIRLSRAGRRSRMRELIPGQTQPQLNPVLTPSGRLGGGKHRHRHQALWYGWHPRPRQYLPNDLRGRAQSRHGRG